MSTGRLDRLGADDADVFDDWTRPGLGGVVLLTVAPFAGLALAAWLVCRALGVPTP